MTVLQALSLLDIDTLVIAPAYEHAEGKQLAPFEARLDMVSRMVHPMFSGNHKRVIVSRVEEDAVIAGGSKGRTSEALKMLPKVHAGYEGAHITLVLGSDLRERIADWSGFSDLADMVKAGDLTFFFVERWLDVSSTKIRQLYALQNVGVTRLVPRDVDWYIKNAGLYR
jgi:nicotinic acid mononucleotide adenylyltransferase